jgi:putative ABC transport system permease protein
MIKNYVIVSLRNLKKQKLFAFINIFGMAVGMTGFALFALTAGVKLNADQFHLNAKRIFSVVQIHQLSNNEIQHSAYTSSPLKTMLLNEIPEIETAVRVLPAGRVTMRYQHSLFYENNVLFVDSNFLTFFTFGMIKGDPGAALTDPGSVVLTEAVANKYFGDSDPLGQILTLGNNIELKVTGVTRNITRASSLRFDFLVSMETARKLFNNFDSWNNDNLMTFVLLSHKNDRAKVDEILTGLMNKNIVGSSGSLKRMYLFPLLDFRLNSEHIESFMASSNRKSVYIILFIGILLLSVVSINFINLSIARYMHRAKEIGLRKVIGARRKQLIFQFIGESTLMSLMALPLVVALFEIIYPVFTSYIGGSISTSGMSDAARSIWDYPFLFKYLLGTSLFVGIISGFYPALYLSAFKPAHFLRGGISAGRKRRFGSKAMIVVQFTLSIIFIAFAGIAKDQYHNLLGTDFGYNKSQIAAVSITGENASKRELLENEFSRLPDIISMSAAQKVPVFWMSPGRVDAPDTNIKEKLTMETYGVDYNFAELMEIQLLEGRSFSRDRADENGFILNESAVKKLGWQNPIGKQLAVNDKNGMIIGVVKDYLFGDIGFDIPPAVLYLERSDLNVLLLKYSSQIPFKNIYKRLNECWRAVYPEIPFDCVSLDSVFRDYLGLINKIAGFFNIIGMAAIFFSCLGLLGLTSYMVERRTREICVRKILGASLNSVIWTIAREFLILVAIADILGLISIYLGWHAILQSGLLFMTDVSVGTYALVVFISLSAAAIAVVSQVFKAARTNPVNALRHE